MDGLQLAVNSVDHDYHPTGLPDFLKSEAVPQPGFHFVRIVVTFTDIAGQHEVTPFEVTLRDALGYQQGVGALIGDPGCLAPPGAAALAPGGRLGPLPLCYTAGGDPTKPPTLVWIPSGLAGAQASAELSLP